MKSTNLVLGMAVIALGFTSCKDDKTEAANKTVESYVVYVDSLENVAVEDAKANWSAIEASYEVRSNQADAAIMDLKENAEAKARIEASRAKYAALQARMNADMQAAVAPSSKQQIRNSFFGEGKVGDDMNFDWVNKDNILSVYRGLIHTAEDNKDSYSREDWDEIKLIYEALDSRKNTVEKEGLSSSDNRDIAGLKFKFAPMLKVNRMGAKSEEMRDAKK
jgi:hypothetical protein